MTNDMRYYLRIIGKLTNISLAGKSLDDILKEYIETVLADIPSDLAIVWFTDGVLLRPYYWIGAGDFTDLSHKEGDGIPGTVFCTQKSLRALNKDCLSSMVSVSELENDFKDMAVSSMICVPLSNMNENLGCIQFIRTKNMEAYSEEAADVIEILADYLAIKVEDNPNIDTGLSRFNKLLLSTKDIHKTYMNGEITIPVLKGVNVDIYEGELLVILGESGCGKSTFLNIIGGMDHCTSGEFSFMGTDMTHADKKALTLYRRNNIGFIFQSYNLMPNLTAKQNLDLIGELVDDPIDSAKALSLVGLEEKMNSYPSQLSGGQQQRVSIARALVKKPKLIFADEPTAALDYATGIEVLSVLEDVAKSGTTVVMVTHNAEITKMADRVVHMRGGKNYETSINKHPIKATELVW